MCFRHRFRSLIFLWLFFHGRFGGIGYMAISRFVPRRDNAIFWYTLSFASSNRRIQDHSACFTESTPAASSPQTILYVCLLNETPWECCPQATINRTPVWSNIHSYKLVPKYAHDTEPTSMLSRAECLERTGRSTAQSWSTLGPAPGNSLVTRLTISTTSTSSSDVVLKKN